MPLLSLLLLLPPLQLAFRPLFARALKLVALLLPSLFLAAAAERCLRDATATKALALFVLEENIFPQRRECF
jgi:hypothetical protein